MRIRVFFCAGRIAAQHILAHIRSVASAYLMTPIMHITDTCGFLYPPDSWRQLYNYVTNRAVVALYAKI
jgi:hypothetical protein